MELYSNIKDERIIAKKAKNKKKDKLFKLILNGFSGLLDSEYFWVYYPEAALRLRVLGQLIMLKALDECIYKGYQVLALNTDSIDCFVDEGQQKEYEEVLDNLASLYKLEFEHECIDFSIYKNINNYIQMNCEGNVKRKGMFKLDFNEKGEREIPLGDSCNELVIPKCLNLFYTKGIPIKEIFDNLEKYNISIFDFCISKKISRDYKVIWNNKDQQRLNRFYVSKNAPYLYKRKKDKTTLENVLVGFGVQIYNNHTEKPLNEYNIDYRYYISKLNSIILELSNNNQISLFN